MPVWQELYESIGPDRFELISVAQDSGDPKAVGRWFDRASPTFRCVIDPTHQISSLFGWVNVPSAAWIDEDGTIVRSNEGTYPGESTVGFGLGKVRFGDDSFARATRDWIKRGADSEYVWSSAELAGRLKPVDEDARRAEATFKLALHFEAVGDSERALKHFAAAQRLAPDNWLYHRQGWTHRGALYAGLKVLRRTSHLRKTTDKSFYDPTGLPGEKHRRFTEPEWLWMPAVRRIKQLLLREA
ncbi:MAG: TlpA family protein disulfide reductase [Acidimicrobiia bacterium]|nr:TlpA family protein disulfide reductase [Acidimicrobiia bacterium]